MGAIIDRLGSTLKLVQADLLKSVKNPSRGRLGMSAEQVLRTLVLKQACSLSYERLAFALCDSTTYRQFCLLGFADEAPTKSTLQENIKKLSATTLEAVNREILGIAQSEGIENGRKVRVDSTATKSNIHEPTDSSLINDVVRLLVRHMKRAKKFFGFEFENVQAKVRLRHLELLRAKASEQRALYKALLKACRKTLREAERIERMIQSHDERSLKLKACLAHFIDLGNRVENQTRRRVIRGEAVPANEKIVSIFEPHTDIIVKDRRGVVYGHKLNLTSGASGLILDCVVEDGNPADSSRAKPMIERQIEIYGRAPRQVSFDGGYASVKNLEEIKDLGVKDVAFNRKRGLRILDMVKSSWVYRQLTRFRAGIEAGISHLKRCFGLDRVTWRSKESFKSYVMGSVVSVNLLILARKLLK